MAMRGIVTAVVVLLWSCWSSGVLGYGRGAPDSACASLTPGHGATPQQSAAPFTVTPLQAVVESGGRLTVRLSSLAGNSFKGFLVQAHDASSTSSQPQPLGQFIAATGSKLMSCSAGSDNSITHNGNANKDQVEVTWQAPTNFTGEIIFRATFVKDYSTFWIRVPSALKVRVQRSIASTTARPVQTLSVYDGCGQTKNCFAFPDNCQSSRNCNALVSFIRKGSVFEFELFGRATASGNSYVAVGFSKDSEMGQDSVNECVNYNGQMNVYTSYNNDLKQNDRRTDANIINVLDARYENGNLYCKFTRQASYSFDGLTFDLNQPHFLLLARGEADQDGVRYHDERMASSNAFDLGTLTTTTTSNVVSTTTARATTLGVPPGSTIGVYEGCGETKNCFGIPNNCQENQKCSALVTYIRNGSDYTFELFGQPVGSSSYVAVGFSKDGEMGEDSVNECVLTGDQVGVYTSQNYDQPQKYNTRISENVADVLAAKYENGNFYCKFTRMEVFTYENITYNLSQPHYLLLARGPANPSSVGPHQQQAETADAVSIGEIGEVHADGEVLLKVHGALMICAWILSASIGILLARYFRQTWVGKQIGGKDLWFVFHRIVMIIVWTLTLISFIIIFVEVDGWTATAAYNPHAIIGCVTTGLAFIQPFMAYFRPHPGTPRRPIFNWAHWTVGNSAHILGIACIFLAVDLPSAGLPEWMRWVLVAYVVFHAVVHLILTILQWQNSKESSQSSSVFPMKELGANGHDKAIDTKKQDAPGSVWRRSLLGVYIVVISGLAAALIAAVVMAPW